MANIKDLKKRIKSTKQTLKITKAMKLISAAKLAKAQDAVLQARPYSEELLRTIKLMTSLRAEDNHPFLKELDSKKICLLVMSSNKGLCGGYNSQLAKLVLEYVRFHGAQNVTVINIGKKVRELVKKSAQLGDLFTFKKSDPSHEEIVELSSALARQFVEGKFGKLVVAYNEFVSAIKFNPMYKTILPMALNKEDHSLSMNQLSYDFKYDVKADVLLDDLIPKAFYSSVYTALLDALASEHGSRMAAMDSASKNCSEQIRKFTLVMNKLRQAEITTELIEVVSGAEALNG
jgi:F-type H+-transporting ATPase subunit gamma